MKIWMVVALLTLSLGAFADFVNAPGDGVRFQPREWKPEVEAVAKDQLYQEPGRLEGRAKADSTAGATQAHEVRIREGVSEFRILGNVPNRRSMQWSAGVGETDLSGFNYCLIRYRAEGLARAHSALPFVSVCGKDAEGKPAEFNLLDSFCAVNDGKWHEILWRKSPGLRSDAVRVRLHTDNSSAYLHVGEIAFYRELPKSLSGFTSAAGDSSGGMKTIDLSSQFNNTFSAALDRVLAKSAVVDGVAALPSGSVSAGGIPFTLAKGGMIARPAESTDWEKESVEFMGEQVPRRWWGPVQRDDRIAFPVGMQTREVFLLLVNEFPVSRGIYSLPTIPYSITDIEGFAVELEYADGEKELAFPFSVADDGFTLRRMAGAYAVPADPARVLRQVSVKNRTYGVTVNLAAATVNTGAKPLLGHVWAEPEQVKPSPARQPRSVKPFITRRGDTLVMGNTYYRVAADTSDGFAITECVNRWAEKTPLKFDPSSGLEVRLGNRVFTGRSFKTERVDVTGRSARITLSSREESLPLRLLIDLSVDDSPELKGRLIASNMGSSPVSADIRFPVLRDISVGSLPDTWYFYPQFRNVVSNEKGFCRHLHDRGFPMQFFDVYNPSAGSGIAFLTRNLEQSPVEYSVSKDDAGVTAYIQFPGTFYPLKPGKQVRFAETALGFHPGDWHDGMDLYRRWLATWYEPVNAQDKEWFLNAFTYTCALISPRYCRQIFRLPTIVDPETGRYHVDEYVEKDREFYDGLLPDFGIFGAWAYDEENDVQREGEYSTKDYDNAGGLHNIRDALERFEQYGIPVAPYTISDRYNRDTEFALKYGDAAAMQRADGWIANDQHQWFPCKGGTLWREHITTAIARLVNDWGAKAVYLDVYGSPANDPCYRESHDHEIPSWTNKSDGEFIKGLRALLPDTAFWSEYPVTDVNCMYHDGWIAYDNLSLHQYFAKHYDKPEAAPRYAELPANVMRFLFPKIKQFCFPVGIEHEDWSPMKYLFFNGQGFAPNPYWLHTTDGRALINQSLRVQREYLDCFTSDRPQPLVPTEKTGVYANMWPAKNRTAWTLYNTRYTTVRGPVLVVDHKPGSKYFDAWNGKPLTPKISNGKAEISLKLDPMGLGCVVRE